MERTILAYPAPPGSGGLGHHAAHVLDSLAPLCASLDVYGPPPPDRAQRHDVTRFHRPPAGPSSWRRRFTWLRYATGRYQLAVDRGFGAWVASEVEARPFSHGYLLTQLAYETLLRARNDGATTILDSPTGHIRDFREVLCRESARWIGWPYIGHPSEAMVERVEAEYALADRIRVSSNWAKLSLVQRGVDPAKVFVAPQRIDTTRFVAPAAPRAQTGPLRLVFVGSFSLGKGFQYLLQAMTMVGSARFQLEMVGATGDRWSRRLFERMTAGLAVTHAPGDPRAAYQRGELFVFPTLHDGFGLVVGEAMASGLPVVTTDHCGAAELIRHGESGWVLPAGDVDALAATLDTALTRRGELADAGRLARQAVERACGIDAPDRLGDLVCDAWFPSAAAARECHA